MKRRQKSSWDKMNLKKFKCSCGTVGWIEVIHTNVLLKHTLEDSGNRYAYEFDEIYDYEEKYYRCAECDKRLDIKEKICIDNDEALFNYIESNFKDEETK